MPTLLRRTLLKSALLSVFLAAGTPVLANGDDPLPSWNDGASKTRILDFVAAVTSEGQDFVAPEARIAVFDNDGTLWSEQPMYVQLAFMLDRVKALAPQHRRCQPSGMLFQRAKQSAPVEVQLR